MHLIRSIIQLLEKGYSFRRIATELKVNRKPVTTYGRRLSECGIALSALRLLGDAELSRIVYSPADQQENREENERKKDFQARSAYFIAELNRTGVTRLLLWEEYRKEYPQGFGYTQFCYLLKEALKINRPVMTLVHKPGVLLMVDFAGENLHYVERSTGELIGCPVLVCVLPYSDYSFVLALPNATIPQCIKALNACMDYLGGVTEALKSDNMKQLVVKACRYEPVFTEALQQWAMHYNITLLATRVARPKDKAKVENEVKIAYRRIYAPLRDKVFYSLQELNSAIAAQLELHNNKPFQRKAFTRKHVFETEEKALLQPLPSVPFVLKHKVRAQVQKNYHIVLGEDWHHYSVPYSYIGKKVTAIYDTDIVEIYYQMERIALHKRSYRRHAFTTSPDHMPDGHRSYLEQQGWTPEYFLGKAEAIGTHTLHYIGKVLNARQFTEQTYGACLGILRLHHEYGTARMEAACMLASQGSRYNYRTLSNILKNNQDKSAAFQTDLFRIPDHTNLRGPEAYE